MDSLYDQDLVLWSEAQARALRSAADAGWNTPIDWENVAEEIESSGRSERYALSSHIAVVIEHLLKLEISPARDPVHGWRDTIRRARRDIERLLKQSPSLRREVAWIVAEESGPDRALVLDNLKDYDEQPVTDIDAIAYTEAQVLGNWLPEQA